MEDGQPAGARVEDADGPRIHGAIVGLGHICRWFGEEEGLRARKDRLSMRRSLAWPSSRRVGRRSRLRDAASAAYMPHLLIARSQPRAPRHVLVIGVGQSRDDDATALIDITVPAGYRESFIAPPGTSSAILGHGRLPRIRRCRSRVIARERREEPTEFTGAPNNLCAPSAGSAHGRLAARGDARHSVRIPVYVDDVTNLPGVSAHSRFCLAAAADTTPSLSSSRRSSVRERLHEPGRAERTSGAVTSRLTSGTARENPAAAVEARGIVPLPIKVTLKQAQAPRVLLTGKIDIPGNAMPAAVEIWGGSSPRS